MRDKSRFQTDRSLVLALVVVILSSACAGAPAPTTTGHTTTTEPAPTTAAPDPCPDTFCVTYRIRPEATWSDGVPVTAADFVHTFELQPSRDGYGLITGYEAHDDKTVQFAFSEPYGPWQTLFDVVLPAHVDDPLSVSAGPFVLGRAGEDELILFRNNAYMATGEVDEIRFVDVNSVRDGLKRLESGELDVIFPPALDWVVDEINQMEGIELAIGPGPVWEHIDFNLQDPILEEPWVREAVNAALDRREIVGSLPELAAVGGFILESAVWPVSSVYYTEAAPESQGEQFARQTLIDNGCSAGADGILVCGETRMSFIYATTAGDPWRRAQFEFARGVLAGVGIELVGRYLAPADLFAEEFLFGGPDQWQMISFPWAFSADPHRDEQRIVCDGELNVSGFCDPEVDELVKAAQTEVDPSRRMELYRDADAAYLAHIPIIPIYQRPMVIAWSSKLIGPEPFYTGSNDLWGVESWVGASEVRIGVENLPKSLDPLSPGDASFVLAPITAGAFGVDASLSHFPDLIESAETIVSNP